MADALRPRSATHANPATGSATASHWRTVVRKASGSGRRSRKPSRDEIPKLIFEPLEARYFLSANLPPLVVALLGHGRAAVELSGNTNGSNSCLRR